MPKVDARRQAPDASFADARRQAPDASGTGLPLLASAGTHEVGVWRLAPGFTLIDVLEHIPYPIALLSKVRDAVEPGGWIVVKVPSGPAQRAKENFRALLRRGYRPRLADNLVHVSHFSPASLRRGLERAGWREIAVAVGPPEFPPAAGVAGRISNLARHTVYLAGRSVPGGVHTPLALNLLAYARRPA